MKIFTGVTLACLAFGILYAVSHRRGGRGPIPDKGKTFIFVVTALIFSYMVVARMLKGKVHRYGADVNGD